MKTGCNSKALLTKYYFKRTEQSPQRPVGLHVGQDANQHYIRPVAQGVGNQVLRGHGVTNGRGYNGMELLLGCQRNQQIAESHPLTGMTPYSWPSLVPSPYQPHPTILPVLVKHKLTAQNTKKWVWRSVKNGRKKKKKLHNAPNRFITFLRVEYLRKCHHIYIYFY